MIFAFFALSCSRNKYSASLRPPVFSSGRSHNMQQGEGGNEVFDMRLSFASVQKSSSINTRGHRFSRICNPPCKLVIKTAVRLNYIIGFQNPYGTDLASARHVRPRAICGFVEASLQAKMSKPEDPSLVPGKTTPSDAIFSAWVNPQAVQWPANPAPVRGRRPRLPGNRHRRDA